MADEKFNEKGTRNIQHKPCHLHFGILQSVSGREYDNKRSNAVRAQNCGSPLFTSEPLQARILRRSDSRRLIKIAGFKKRVRAEGLACRSLACASGRGGRGGGGAQEGRLAKALVDSKLADSASMGFQLLYDPGLVSVSASLNQDQSLDKARDASTRRSTT